MPIKDGSVRRFPRFRIRGVTGTITIPDEVDVLDLSLGGALVEHEGMVHIGAICFLDLPTSGEPVSMRCRVVHSQVTRREHDGGLYCRTGVEFLDFTPEIEQTLEAVIRSYGAR